MPIPTNDVGSGNSHQPDSADLPDGPQGLLSPSVRKEMSLWPTADTTIQYICLMRFFVREMAPWVSHFLEYTAIGDTAKLTLAKFDLCDPASHFTLIVPRRARQCPPLLNAILTAAAKGLVKTCKYRTKDGLIEYGGVKLPNLTANTAIEYHNACITHILDLSNHLDHFQDENLLAAGDHFAIL